MRIMMWSSRMAIAVVLMIAAISGDTRAGLITFTETAVGSGSLAGVAYNNVLVTLTATADTSNVTSSFGLFTVTPITATVNVAGLGSGTFTSSTFEIFNNPTFTTSGVTGIAGFADSSSGTLLGTSNTAFQTYGLTSSIGPLSGPSFVRSDLTFATTAGTLALTSAGQATFTASIVPEPSSFVLCGIAGFIGLAVVKVRRQRVSIA